MGRLDQRDGSKMEGVLDSMNSFSTFDPTDETTTLKSPTTQKMQNWTIPSEQVPEKGTPRLNFPIHDAFGSIIGILEQIRHSNA